MKKFIFIAAAALACAISANAQEKQYKPEAMDFSLEMNYTPGTTGRFVLPEYGVKGRLFISDRFAVKLNLGFTTNSDKTISYTQQASSTGLWSHSLTHQGHTAESMPKRGAREKR